MESIPMRAWVEVRMTWPHRLLAGAGSQDLTGQPMTVNAKVVSPGRICGVLWHWCVRC